MLAQFVRLQDRGLIRLPKSFDESAITRELAAAYPAQKIIVLSSKVTTLEKLARRLCKDCTSDEAREQIAVNHGQCPLALDVDQEMPHVTCSTYREAASLDFATSDLVLFVDAYECVHGLAQQALEVMDAQFRLFGIVRAGRSVSPYEEAITMRVFGFELLDLMSHGRTRRDVHVAWVRHNQPPIHLERKTSDFDFRCLFHNARRNRVIAKIAKALDAGTPIDAHKYPDVAEWCDANGHGPHRVIVLVDRLDHAVALERKLPGWPIITSKGTSFRGYPGSVRNRLKRGQSIWAGGSPWEYGQRQIVLTDAPPSFAGYYSDVVIWAGSGPWAAPIPGAWLGERCGSHCPLLVVDFFDLFNPQTQQWSWQRRDDYAQQDIFDVGVHPVLGRMERFLGAKLRGEE